MKEYEATVIVNYKFKLNVGENISDNYKSTFIKDMIKAILKNGATVSNDDIESIILQELTHEN